MSILNTSETAIRTYAMPANTAEVVASAANLYGSEYYQYVEKQPFVLQALIEAFQRNYFRVTMPDGTVRIFDVLNDENFRQPDTASFVAFLQSEDFQNCTSLIGATMGRRAITLRRETDGGWSVWLRRQYATYEISTVYQCPWRDMDYAPELNEAGENTREIVAVTNSAYLAIAVPAHKEWQVTTLSRKLQVAVEALAPDHEAVCEPHIPANYGMEYHPASINCLVPRPYDRDIAASSLMVMCASGRAWITAVSPNLDQYRESRNPYRKEWYLSLYPNEVPDFKKIAEEIITLDGEIGKKIAAFESGEIAIGRPARTPRDPNETREEYIARKEAARLAAVEA